MDLSDSLSGVVICHQKGIQRQSPVLGHIKLEVNFKTIGAWSDHVMSPMDVESTFCSVHLPIRKKSIQEYELREGEKKVKSCSAPC